MYAIKKNIIIFSVAVLMLTACAAGKRVNVLVPDGSDTFLLMDFGKPFPLDPLPDGWHHQKFLRHPPMDMSFVTKDNKPSLRIHTQDSASMLFRHVNVPLESYPLLSWDWYIEKPVESEIDERTFQGDDHPARYYLDFKAPDGETHAMELIWGNKALKAGDWKHLESFWGLYSFPHYVVNGGNENTGKWFHEKVDLSALYRKLWGDPKGARLMVVAIFCDTDETGKESVVYFSNVRAEKY